MWRAAAPSPPCAHRLPRNPLDEIVHVTVGVFAGYQMPEWSGTPEDFPGVISLQGTCLVAHLFHGAPDSRSQQG